MARTLYLRCLMPPLSTSGGRVAGPRLEVCTPKFGGLPCCKVKGGAEEVDYPHEMEMTFQSPTWALSKFPLFLGSTSGCFT